MLAPQCLSQFHLIDFNGSLIERGDGSLEREERSDFEKKNYKKVGIEPEISQFGLRLNFGNRRRLLNFFNSR